VLGEKLEPVTVLFSLAVVAVVFIGKRMPADTKTQVVVEDKGEQTPNRSV
jgi:hypothetical protein